MTDLINMLLMESSLYQVFYEITRRNVKTFREVPDCGSKTFTLHLTTFLKLQANRFLHFLEYNHNGFLQYF